MSDSNHIIELLGQKIPYPTNKWAAASVTVVTFFICATIVALAHYPRAWDMLEKSMSMGILNENGKVNSIGKVYQIQFWTPSPKTQTVAGTEPWEKINEETAIKFGNLLIEKTDKINGFRRYEVYGMGKTPLKPGYWWVITAKQGYELTEFRETYRTFWKTDRPIYVEVLREGGRYEP